MRKIKHDTSRRNSAISVTQSKKHSNVLAMTVMTVVCFATVKSDTLQANESGQSIILHWGLFREWQLCISIPIATMHNTR